LFGVAAAKNINTESVFKKLVLFIYIFPEKLTESHINEAYRRELQDDERPYSRVCSSGVGGYRMACRHVLELEHGVDNDIHNDAN
jgi:hypothetical protein